MRYSSNHSGTENVAAQCSLCGASVVRDANRPAKVVCLICRAAILNRIFQVRRQRELRAPSGSDFTRISLLPVTS